jgi:hypothetical protein
MSRRSGRYQEIELSFNHRSEDVVGELLEFQRLGIPRARHSSWIRSVDAATDKTRVVRRPPRTWMAGCCARKL